jgi:hypothetical protein
MDKREPSEITPYCLCSKCGSEVPYISRRCIAIEDQNGTLIFLGKRFKLLNLCLSCLKEFYAEQQIEAMANGQPIAKLDLLKH